MLDTVRESRFTGLYFANEPISLFLCRETLGSPSWFGDDLGQARMRTLQACHSPRHRHQLQKDRSLPPQPPIVSEAESAVTRLAFGYRGWFRSLTRPSDGHRVRAHSLRQTGARQVPLLRVTRRLQRGRVHAPPCCFSGWRSGHHHGAGRRGFLLRLRPRISSLARLKLKLYNQNPNGDIWAQVDPLLSNDGAKPG